MGQRLRACVRRALQRAQHERGLRPALPRPGPARRARSDALCAARLCSTQPAGLLDRVKHRIALILSLGVLGAAAGFGIAFVQAPVFKGETSIQVGRDLGVAANEDTLKTSAALAIRYADLARREPVLGPLVERRAGPRPGETSSATSSPGSATRTHSWSRSVSTPMIAIAPQSSRPQWPTRCCGHPGAAIESDDQFFLRSQVTGLEDDIAAAEREAQRLRDRLPTATAAQVAPRAPRPHRRCSRDAGRAAQQLRRARRDGHLRVRASSAIVDPAWTTRSPAAPHAVVLAIAGLAIGLTLAIGWIHLFDRRPPDTRSTGDPTEGPARADPTGSPSSTSAAGTDTPGHRPGPDRARRGDDHDLERR